MGQEAAKAWIDQVSGADSLRKVARRAGVNDATLHRQINKLAITPEMLVAIARAYGRPPLDGLIALGLITHDETRATTSVHGATDVQLVREIADRVSAAADAAGWLQPDADAAGAAADQVADEAWEAYDAAGRPDDPPAAPETSSPMGAAADAGLGIATRKRTAAPRGAGADAASRVDS